MTFATKVASTLKWLPSYGVQALRRAVAESPQHLIVALADHFEPPYTGRPKVFRSVAEQVDAVRRWCAAYPSVVDRWRDADGQPFVHTYFYPAEHYHADVIGPLAEHCRAGWGEVEVHLHHGTDRPDTAENTRGLLTSFRTRLAEHGCLSYLPGDPLPRYGFVHGNWALANSGGGSCCGVDEELEILAQTGCYADFTLPSFPNRAQVSKINSIYQPSLPLNRRAPHRKGRDLQAGVEPTVFPVIVQGPLMVDFNRRKAGFLPGIENSEIASYAMPSLHRAELWQRAAIVVKGRPEWRFIKLHCHGMAPWDEPMLLGSAMSSFLRDFTEAIRASSIGLHFVTARELVNIALAACDGKMGNPGEYRDYWLRQGGHGSAEAHATDNRDISVSL
jgi:hypothetical protein